MIVSRFTSFTENFVICCYQVTNMSRSGHDCTSTPSARSPRYFRLQADIAIWVLREVTVDTVLTLPNPVPPLLATPLVIHEKNWTCLDVHAQGFTVARKDYVHQANFL